MLLIGFLFNYKIKQMSQIILESQSAFILRNGTIVDLDGSSPVHFAQTADDYFISVKDRNHLAVMSTSAITLTN